MVLKSIGYYISKGKCIKAYSLKKKSRSGKIVTKKVNYKKNPIKKGTKIFKTKKECVKVIKRKMKKMKKKKLSPKRKVNKHRTRFGKESCGNLTYGVPYFGSMVPSISKTFSGTPGNFSSTAWAWPTPRGSLSIDRQQGGWYN